MPRKKPRAPSVDEDGAPRNVIKKEELVVKREVRVKRERRSRDQENNKSIWESNQNYISGGSESEEEEEERKASTSKRPTKKNGKKDLPRDEDSDHESSEQVEAGNGTSDNGVKSIQLGEGEKKLDVIMLFE